jgi:formylglycine-generating enzyme required for sulfatase activity
VLADWQVDDCAFGYYKEVLGPELMSNEVCGQDLTCSSYTMRDGTAVDLALPPVAVDCSATTNWRDLECGNAGRLGGLANELDFLQFFWDIYAHGEDSTRLGVNQIEMLMRYMCNAGSSCEAMFGGDRARSDRVRDRAQQHGLAPPPPMKPTTSTWVAVSIHCFVACARPGQHQADPSLQATASSPSEHDSLAPERVLDAEAVETAVTNSAPPIVQEPVPAPPTVPFISNPSFPNCVHPGVVEDCNDGWCRIPAGCFVYGSPEDEYGRSKYDEHQASVPLSHDFEIMQTEVTQAAWQKTGWAMRELPDYTGTSVCDKPTCPMEPSTWFWGLRYANWLSEQAGLAPCYTLTDCEEASPVALYLDFSCTVTVNAASIYECEGYRLPTSGEWEYAARAGTTSAYYSGPMDQEVDLCVLDENLARTAWYCFDVPDAGTPAQQAQPVAQLLPNAWGLYDVLGNASEWVSDDFVGVGWEDPYPDPEGQIGSSSQGTVRGCSFYSAPFECRVALKLPVGRDERHSSFRLARTLGVGSPPTLGDVPAPSASATTK